MICDVFQTPAEVLLFWKISSDPHSEMDNADSNHTYENGQLLLIQQCRFLRSYAF